MMKMMMKPKVADAAGRGHLRAISDASFSSLLARVVQKGRGGEEQSKAVRSVSEGGGRSKAVRSVSEGGGEEQSKAVRSVSEGGGGGAKQSGALSQ